ncbi:DNA kinase/phosphatase Pnk1 [Cordyceps fumosorosea ARSEF 2679]|uniref:DNA kinase/phosphatase Pnk1 n=1 Tax=Cordyceps fumosorosea (strain ARSEF 2679) TaxID=1081104 RepID=A0A167VYX9_CORFA|nr:DNA kinase/phosphatase Pnk1 [Cordyceps fumosorosea ARSEF 2679]OAA63134.1 DNA kinase/phosphatase Pnk1 [Cordyceps fumosorosea ARSEF 2679]
MSSKVEVEKRKATEPISPPPTKRSLASGTTKSAISNFFTPTSQKPKDRTSWSERKDDPTKPATLLVGKYTPDGESKETQKRRKIAAFDLDSTLIDTSSGRKHAKDASDWRWWDAQVPGKLKELYEDGYQVAILSNQGGITLHADPKQKSAPKNPSKRLDEFKEKGSSILRFLDLPITVYAATAKDNFRKPRRGMWDEILRDMGVEAKDIDLEQSFFVGDAGGRGATVVNGAAIVKDFSCSDRNLAHNVGVSFKTPEEYFLGQEPRKWERDLDLVHYPLPSEDGEATAFTKKNAQEMVIFCGRPGAGKSTFYWKFLEPLGYERVNQDTLKTREKCIQVAKAHLEDGRSVAVDNTNADPSTRKLWIDLAQSLKVPIRCVSLSTPAAVCRHNDAVRSLNKSLNPEEREVLPEIAFTGFQSRYKPPQESEGFEDITEVEFRFRGTKEDYAIWGRYWL